MSELRDCPSCKRPTEPKDFFKTAKYGGKCRFCVNQYMRDRAKRLKEEAALNPPPPRNCSECGASSLDVPFVNDPTHKRCTKCHASRRAKYREENRELVLKQHAASRKKHPETAGLRKYHRSDRTYWLCATAKHRAKKKGLEFDITPEDVVIPEVCPVFGTPLDLSGKDLPNSPSLDRIDSSKGYVKGNVAVISHRANSMKRDGTAEDHERIAAWMRSFSSA